MSKDLTPTSNFGLYPVKVPLTGEDLLAQPDSLQPDVIDFESIMQDLHNRLLYLKNTTDSLQLYYNDLIIVDNDLQNQINDIKSQIVTIEQDIDTLEDMVDGVVYESNNYINDNDSHRVALQKIDSALKITNDILTVVQANLVTHNSKINSLGNKVSSTAFDGNLGFPFTGAFYLASGDMVDVALDKLDPAVESNRRINAYNFDFINNLWKQSNSGISLFYENFIDESKIYYNVSQPSSTTGAIDVKKQLFGLSTDETWYYYNNIVTVPSSNRVKIKVNKSSAGILNVYCTLDGLYESTAYTLLDLDDTWITVPAGVSLIIKIVGSNGAKLYSLSLITKTE